MSEFLSPGTLHKPSNEALRDQQTTNEGMSAYQQRRVEGGRLEAARKYRLMDGMHGAGYLVFISLLSATLILTNPFNSFSRNILPKGSFESVRWIDSSGGIWSRASRKNTNYLFFGLTKDGTDVHLVGLTKSSKLCSTLGTQNSHESIQQMEGYLCEAVARELCHGKPFMIDPDDVPYTFCCLLVCLLFFQLAFMRRRFWIFFNSQQNEVWFWGTSFFTNEGSLHGFTYDVLQVSWILYPSLQTMYRLIASYTYEQVFVNIHFALGICVLCCVIGGISNKIGSSVGSQHLVLGLDSTAAAALGYQISLGSRTLSRIFFAGGTDGGPTPTLFWLRVALFLFDGRIGQLLSYCVGGMLGHAFGVFHRDWWEQRLLQSWDVARRRFMDNFFMRWR